MPVCCRLAPTSVHVCGFIWEWTQAKSKSPLNTQGALRGRGVGGHTFKSLGKLSNGCTDWHRIFYTSADSSGNGHSLNPIRPTILQEHFGGFYWVTNSNVWGSRQTAGPIGTKFGTNMRIRVGMCACVCACARAWCVRTRARECVCVAYCNSMEGHTSLSTALVLLWPTRWTQAVGGLIVCE